MLRYIRVSAWIAIAVAAIVASIMLMGDMQQSARNSATSPIPIGGAFELITHEGKEFSSTALAGRPYLLFFGFTHCPDICPTTLLEVSNLLNTLGSDADKPAILFVTVDPERDTPEHLKAYLSSFDPRIIGLTGTKNEIATMAKLYRAFYEKVPSDDGDAADYTMNHTATVYMFDKAGRLASTLSISEDEKSKAAKMKKLVSG